MKDVQVSPQQAIAILRQEGLDTPPRGENRMLRTGAEIHRARRVEDGWWIYGYHHSGQDVKPYIPKSK